MSTFNFIFRDGHLGLRIEHRGVERFVSTRYDVRENEWNAAAGWLVTGDVATARHRRLAVYAQAMERDLRLLREIAAYPRITARDIASAYLSAMAGNQMLGVYAKCLSEEWAREGRRRTSRGYLTAARRFIDFNGGNDMRLDNLTPETIAMFERTLENDNLEQSTISFYMRTLRAIYNRAVAECIVPARLDNPFDEAYTRSTLVCFRSA
jgi:hypothetical protein